MLVSSFGTLLTNKGTFYPELTSYMTEQDIEFFEYFTQAQLEALKDRDRQIVELRYGLTGSKPCTLASIANIFGISRERIRQLLDKAHKKIHGKGQRQLKANTINTPCAELLLYVRSIIRPHEPNSVERLVEFSRSNLYSLPQQTHAIPLLGNLTYSDKIIRRQSIEKAKKILQELEYEQIKYYKQQKLLSKFKELLSYVIYPGEVKKLKESSFQEINRQREVSLEGKGTSGDFYSNKLNRLVQYESSLEMNFLLYLENLDDVIFYQEQPLRIFYEFEEKGGFYYPDFLFILKDGVGIVTEIKPIFQMALQRNLAKWSALKAYCSQHGLGLLVTDGRYTIQQIQQHQVKPDFSNYVLEKLYQGNMIWTEYKKIKEQFKPSRNDFVSLVLNNRLIWKLNPFFLGFQP